MPETAFRHQAIVPAPPAAVWARLQDPDTWATVAAVDATSAHRHEGDRLEGFRFTTSIGRARYEGEARVTQARKEEAMTLSIRSTELTGDIRISLRRDDPGTELDVEMWMRPAGILGTMVFPMVTSAVSNGFEESVERLAAALT